MASIDIIKKTGTHGLYNYATPRGILYIVIHYTAGVTSKKGSARNTAAYFASKNAGGTADFIVDDAEIVQYNPDPSKHACWAVGGSKYNNKGGKLYGVATNKNCISIEICSNNKLRKITTPNDCNWYFTEKALANAKKLTKYLMAKYDIPASRVIRHYDVTGKLCPGIRGWNADSGNEDAWRDFKDDIEEVTAPKKKSDSGASMSAVKGNDFKWTVTVANLRVRKGPGTGYPATGKYTGKGTFTITEKKNGFGKLKSGVGWISLASAYGHKA